MSGGPEQRISSQIQRTVHDGVASFEKQYVVNDWDDDFDVIRRRARDEVDLLDRIATSELFGGRLGTVKVVRSDPEAATIATREIPGSSLAEFVMQGAEIRSRRMPWYLAGRWLRKFHELPLTRDAEEFVSSRDPVDLVEYCDLRLCSLADYGYRWPSDSKRMLLLQVIKDLREQCTQSDLKPVWVHSDFSPGNLMWDGRVLTPIDFAMVSSGSRFADATYLIHRIEMQRVYRPWLRLPVDSIRGAILRGLGVPEAESFAAYRMLMIKHLICRLHTYVRRPPKSVKQAMHDRWVRMILLRRLEKFTQFSRPEVSNRV